jgi:hypothetical protein
VSYLDIFNQRNSAYGDSIRDIRIESTKLAITNSFTNSPFYYQVAIDNSSVPIDTQIVDDSQTRDEKILTTPYETLISLGNILTWKTDKWIVIHFDEMSEIYKRCKIRKCLSTLKWLREDGEIQEVDFTYRSQAATNFGITDDRVLTLGNERRQLIIPSNVETLKIKKDRRFIFDERCWKVTAMDKLDIGVIYITLEENEINPAVDRVDLRIADYVGNVASYSITILGGNTISIQAGKTLQLESEVTNNGVIVTDRLVTYSSSNASIVTINSNGLLSSIANGNVVITASLIDYPTVADTQNVTVQLTTPTNMTVEIYGSDTVNKGYSQHYTIEVKNNGVLDNTQHVQWYLFADDGVSSPVLAQLINAQFTQCDIKGLGLGYVILKCIVTGYASVSTTKRINIKSII